jgi:hypothetical protein
VLAIALLRRLGVPARGVSGWVAIDGTLGLHFWAEVKVGGRWIPIDPAFDQTPASAFRIKLNTSDLADMGSIGWESAALNLRGGTWQPDEDWSKDLSARGERLSAPGGITLRVAGGKWRLQKEGVQLMLGGAFSTDASIRPSSAHLRGARRLQGGSGLKGWWSSLARALWLELEGHRWLRIDVPDEGTAFDLLERLEAQFQK